MANCLCSLTKEPTLLDPCLVDEASAQIATLESDLLEEEDRTPTPRTQAIVDNMHREIARWRDIEESLRHHSERTL